MGEFSKHLKWHHCFLYYLFYQRAILCERKGDNAVQYFTVTHYKNKPSTQGYHVSCCSVSYLTGYNVLLIHVLYSAQFVKPTGEL